MVILKALTEEMAAGENLMTMEHRKNFVNKPVISIPLVLKVVSRLLIVLMTVLIIRLVNVYRNTIRLVILPSERKVSELLVAVNIKNVVISVLIINIHLFPRVM